MCVYTFPYNCPEQSPSDPVCDAVLPGTRNAPIGHRNACQKWHWIAPNQLGEQDPPTFEMTMVLVLQLYSLQFQPTADL